MKKFLLGIFITFCAILCFSFAQNIQQPDSATISVKDPVIKGEATNLTITMTKNGSKLSGYKGTIFIVIYDENGTMLNDNECTLPSQGLYQFQSEDLGSKTFQKGLEIKKTGVFYIVVEDLENDEEYGRQKITVTNGSSSTETKHIDVYSPTKDIPLTSEKIDILAVSSELPNSPVNIYLDDKIIQTSSKVYTDSIGQISYTIPNISAGNHSIRLEIEDIDGNILGKSDTINFTYSPENSDLFKSISIEPENGLMVNDTINVTVITDETTESVKMRLSDRSENDYLVLNKEKNGKFSKSVFLVATGTVSISLELAASNNSKIQTFTGVKEFNVLDIPVITNITTETNADNQTADIHWDLENGPVSKYLLKYGFNEDALNNEEEITNGNEFRFTGVPYDTTIYLQITPYRTGSSNSLLHGAASKTIQFIISKNHIDPVCGSELFSCTIGTVGEKNLSLSDDTTWTCLNDNTTISCSSGSNTEPVCGTTEYSCILGNLSNTGSNENGPLRSCTNNNKTTLCSLNGDDKQPKCIVQNISTRTEKIGDSYYLIRDPVENVSKYIIYSSSTPNISDRIKIYETSDTSYEYPFDHSAEEDQFMYFWIEGICDDGEELELSGATKVQVGPSENFFLLICMTFLVYFGIKLFRQTEE